MENPLGKTEKCIQKKLKNSLIRQLNKYEKQLEKTKMC
jgi:hypothetical protein